MARRVLEHLAKFSLALAVELPHDFRTVEVNEVHAAFGRYGAGQQSFARARRAVQQDALRRQNSQTFEDARVFQRQLDHFADACYFALQSADIFVGYRRNSDRFLLAFHDSEVGGFPDHDRPRGNRAHHLEVHRLGKCRHTHDAAGDDRNAFQILQYLIGRNGRRRGPNPQRRQANRHCLSVLDERHRHLLLQPRAAITAAGAVHLGRAFLAFVRELGTRDADGTTGDLQHVARLRAQAQQVGWRQSGNRTADVLDTRFSNTQRESCHGSVLVRRDGRTAHVNAQVSQSDRPHYDVHVTRSLFHAIANRRPTRRTLR